MARKQQKKQNGGGFFNFLGLTSGSVTVDESKKRLQELESKSPKDLATMVVDLESKVAKLETKIKELENPKAPETGVVAAAGVAPTAPAATPKVGGDGKDDKDTNSSGIPPELGKGSQSAAAAGGSKKRNARKTRRNKA